TQGADESLIRRALESDPDSPEGHLFLGIALLDQNRLDEAEKSLREALLRKPPYPNVYLVLADVHAKRKDYQSQVQDLDAYLKLVPSSAASADVRKVRDTAKRQAPQLPIRACKFSELTTNHDSFTDWLGTRGCLRKAAPHASRKARSGSTRLALRAGR